MASRALLHHRLAARRHATLLVAIVVAFAIRPVIGGADVGPVAFSLALVALCLVALHAIQVEELIGDREMLLARRRRRRIIAWVLAAAAVVERLAVIVAPDPRLYLAGALCWLGFFAFVTWIELRSVLEHRDVTGETISMAISVYLLIGVTWGLLYFVVFQLDHQAFSFERFSTAAPDPMQDLQAALPIFMYFSLTTLSTLGFGDITPVSLQARYAAVAEGITGQLYLAILVARLVSMQISGGRKAT
jgi:amino acid transporter